MTALQETGLATSVLPVDLGAEVCPVIPPIEAGESVISRGWMLGVEKYGALMALCEGAQAAAVTLRFHYLCCHYIPNGYSTIDDLTPETVFGTLEELKVKV